MRTLFILALGLGCAFLAGWFTINRDGGETTIKINRDEIKNDAKSALAKGQKYLRRNEGDPNQVQPQGQQPYGQTVPVGWNGQQQQQQQYGDQQYTAGYQNQQYPQQQQQPYQGQQGQNYQGGQTGQQGGFHYPAQQHANRPPAPWEGQLNPPAQQQPLQGGQY